MLSAPAFANSATCRSGRSIIRWTSISAPASCTWSASALTISAPNVIGGTKCPSMTSTWITLAPAPSTSATCSPSRAKSADRIDGATWRSRRISLRVGTAASGFALTRLVSRIGALDGFQHAALAVVARDDRRARHAHDRRMLAAVRADRDELIAPQAVNAAVAAWHRRRTEPRLAASGALWTELDRGFAAH